MKLAVFGAQGYALGVCKALKILYPRREILCFLVSEMGMNAAVLEHVPVRVLSDFSEGLTSDEKKGIEILIATPENVQQEIEELLEYFGFPCYRRIHAERWEELMKLFHIKMGKFLPLAALPVGYHTPFVRIYMAKSHKDVPLKSSYNFPSYIIPIQVGADCSDVRICNLMDNIGDNISGRNANYSELTALYWIWKNKLISGGAFDEESRQYYGLVQYRRVFGFCNDDLLRLFDNEVDVILPYPMPYEPNIHAHHKRYIKEDDWNAMLQVLGELQPEYVGVFEDILEQQYLYNYNIILAKKQVLCEYCAWLFPILQRTEELSVPKGCERSDRYIGYMGETLETLYFMKNADKLNIVHTGCRVLI